MCSSDLVVTTSEEKIADIAGTAPVGTTQALIEQGAAVFSAIHARLHDSQRRVLGVLSRINRWYLDDMYKGDMVQELPIRREDFKRNTDMYPGMAKTAREEGHDEIADWFETLAKAERSHANRYAKALAELVD